MDILILDSWLKEFLIASASPEKIAECLTLSGPSIEKIEKYGKDSIYHIEVTTNRVDTASVYGIAKEAGAILPRFKIPAKLKRLSSESLANKFTDKVGYLSATIDQNLCKRFSAVLIKNVKIADSPELIKNRLASSGVRAINNVVDITNYIMLMLGQPVHAFDYDKIKGAKMILRESKKGEKITTLDGKTFNLPGGDIVIEDGEGNLIDLAGIMGGSLSAVDENTKNVLLFVQTYNPTVIRKTSMALAQRTIAATIFEKGVDPELVAPAILEGIKLFKDLTGGIPEKDILNIYPKPYKVKKVTTDISFIQRILGIPITKPEITSYLNSLQFETKWSGGKLEVGVPSYRADDFAIEEDIAEEVARLYGYHNLPSKIMEGPLPMESTSDKFGYEMKLKNILVGWGGMEVYTQSLTSKENVSDSALKLKNPLGTDSEYLRTSLMPSLIEAANENKGTTPKFHLFEMANIYEPIKSSLPNEKLIFAGIFEGYKYREAKGVVEALFVKLFINPVFKQEENRYFTAGRSLSVYIKGDEVGKFGFTDKSNYIYYEFDVAKLFKLQGKATYKDIPKFPAQIEDITFAFPQKTKVGEVMDLMKNLEPRIKNVELKDVYKDAYTLRVWYQDLKKTLTNAEVEKIRSTVLSSVKNKFGGTVKD